LHSIGTSPDTEASPAIPSFFYRSSIAYDLISNPAETKFLQQAKAHSAKKMDMTCLFFQAEKSGKFEINKNVLTIYGCFPS
jgi:shikimate 5-dehydrogenase